MATRVSEVTNTVEIENSIPSITCVFAGNKPLALCLSRRRDPQEKLHSPSHPKKNKAKFRHSITISHSGKEIEHKHGESRKALLTWKSLLSNITGTPSFPKIKGYHPRRASFLSRLISIFHQIRQRPPRGKKIQRYFGILKSRREKNSKPNLRQDTFGNDAENTQRP